jgi:hypothetical protein
VLCPEVAGVSENMDAAARSETAYANEEYFLANSVQFPHPIADRQEKG